MEFRDKWFDMNEDKDPASHRNAFYLNFFWMVFVGDELLARYDAKDEHIRDMKARDEAQDRRVESARLTSEPVCSHCGKTGLRIIDKSLMRRDGNGEDDLVIFMLKCTSCGKNSAYWEDGKKYEHRRPKCPKCNSEMDEKSTRTAKMITTFYTCPSCGHRFKDKLDLTVKKDKPDPQYGTDRALYCFHDRKQLEEHRDAKFRYEGLARLGEEWKEKEDNKDVYDAVANIQKLKIAQLHEVLKPAIELAGYKEVSFGKPAIGREVIVSVSCLDGDAKREDYDSRKALKKAITVSLEPTNWRLVSNDVEYRLGYLTGRVRAYEREEDLIRLIKKTTPKKK
jgi:predicted RNA-binding Zn-ribbon protein involved in translation (DUF1610 family)